ncbi:MAG: hypothetical protein WBC85_02890 [Planktotalea sp.]|uniref:hypothetical protein n=1 Tax=Planktotalea sp. TaxID=2029877 RepID=UPI003C78DA3E
MSELSAAHMSFARPAQETSFLSGQTVRRFIGLVFAMCAVGLWFAPGASATAEVLLLKTGLTGVLTFCAMAAFLRRK